MPYNTWLKVLLFLLIIISLLFRTGGNTDKTPLYYQFKAIHAYNRKDYSAFLDNLEKANELAPDNPNIMLNLARAYALTDNKKASIEYLSKAIHVRYYPTSKQIADFSTLRGSEAFESIQDTIQRIKSPVNKSQIAFKIPQRDLLPEGIAYDPVEGNFYIGGIHRRKIITIDNKGIVTDFASENQDGLQSVAGMRIDAKRRLLWVATSPFYRMKGFNPHDFGHTYVFQYNLDNKRLLKKYTLDERPILHYFNDLVLNSRGDVFITDSLFGAIYKINHQSKVPELFIKPERFTFPNGIALSTDERYLFAAHIEGISVIDTNTKFHFLLTHLDDVNLTGIEGLYFCRNALVAIQNDNWYGRVIELLFKDTGHRHKPSNISTFSNKLFFPSDTLWTVRSARILESGNPLFSHPTTGVIVGDFLYYIANSQQSCFQDNGAIFPINKLKDIFVFKVRL